MNCLRSLPLVCVIAALYFLLWARLAVTTPGRFASEPAEWWVVVRMEPDPDDRWLDVIADGPLYRAQGFQLEGARSPRIRQIWFKGLTAGCYDFIAEVRRVDQDGPIVARAVAPWPLSVSGAGLDGDPCG